jgi:hypothetical protein
MNDRTAEDYCDERRHDEEGLVPVRERMQPVNRDALYRAADAFAHAYALGFEELP